MKKISKQMLFLYGLLHIVFTISSCTPPILKEDNQQNLDKKYIQDREYILQQTIVLRDKYTLNKGTRVKVFSKYSDDWIKIYAYKADDKRLDTTPILALYITRAELPDEKFNAKEFDKQFRQVFRKN